MFFLDSAEAILRPSRHLRQSCSPQRRRFETWRGEIKELQSEYDAVAREQMRAPKQQRSTRPYDDELTAIMQRLTTAQRKLGEAEAFAAERQLQWERISAAINETRNLAATWDAVGPEERCVLFDWWVLMS